MIKIPGNFDHVWICAWMVSRAKNNKHCEQRRFGPHLDISITGGASENICDSQERLQSEPLQRLGGGFSCRNREETKGRFRKGRFGECTLVPVFGTGEHQHVPLFRFWYRGTSECTLVPFFGAGEHPPNHPFGNTFLPTPEGHLKKPGAPNGPFWPQQVQFMCSFPPLNAF